MTLDCSAPSELSMWVKFYIYALHGYFSEIAFTAIWEFVVTYKFTLMGTTSLWTMPIYGISGVIVERMCVRMKFQGIPALLRALLLVVWTYFWEFSTGYLLRLIGACPWDYEPFDWDFMGLICLEYAPAWFVAALLFDSVLIPYVLHLQWKPTLTSHKME